MQIINTNIFGLITELPDNFISDFKSLLTLSPLQIEKVDNLVNTKNGFDIPGKIFCKKAEEIKIEPEILVNILKISKFFYDKMEEEEPKKEYLIEDINKFIDIINEKEDDKKIKLNKRKFQAIVKLLYTRKKEYEIYSLAQQSKFGIISSIAGYTFLHDVRAIFDPETSKVDSYLPVVITRLRVIDDLKKEKTIKMQFSEKMLIEFKNKIEEAIKNLSKVSKELKEKGLKIYEEESEEKINGQNGN